MARGGARGESSKKAAGNAKKAENAAAKAAVQAAQSEAAEAAKWEQGAKSNKKQQDAEAKKAEAERKKAEKAALQAEDEANAPVTVKSSKSAQKKSNRPAPSSGLDLSQLDDAGPSGTKSQALNATGIDNALDALALTGSSNNDKVEKHPEKRFKAAYAAFEARRLPEIEEENPGLRRNQRIELCRKEFEKSPDNPFNQVSVRYDANREDIADMKERERRKVEDRLAEK